MFKRLGQQDYYQVLEVDYDAAPEDIQKAYENTREVYGTESLVSTSILTQDERRQILARVTEAYNTLIAEESRRLYDRSLAEGRVARDRVAEVPPMRVEERKADPGPSKPYPRLVKGGASTEGTRWRATVELGPNEEATGTFLRRRRESMGLDLRTISEDTKIGVTMLGYIEEERLDRLPAPVYLRNFVAQYARCLGLEEERIATSYLSRIRQMQSKETDSWPPRDSSSLLGLTGPSRRDSE